MTLAGRVFSNRYEIQRELAQGGMAEVYLARDQLLNRPVALKALFPEFAREPSFVERFRREAQAAANLNHPNIVAIYDWGQETGTYFIVMEYVEGRSLRDLIRAEAPIDANTTAEISAEIAAALGFAHNHGVVHRDVKPGNVLLTQQGTVKVTDFGIARAGTSDGLTQTGSVMGTATYFSPEQAQGLAVDGRSDVYSLGVVMYEMVTGVPPFSGDSPVAVAYKHVREEPIPPSERNPDVAPGLEQVILTALAKDPEHRYQSADDLRADLLRFRRGRPLAAAPVTALVAEVPTGATAATRAAGSQAYAAAAATVATPRVDERGRYAGTTGTPRKKRNTALVWTLTLLALAAVIGGILFAAIKLGQNQAQVTVPNEVGKKSAAAVQDLTAHHLTPAIKRVADATHPPDTVIAQNPAAHSTIGRGDTVTLTVSSGAAQKQIPFDIVTPPKSVADATHELTQLGFIVDPPKQQSSDQVKAGFVINSAPAPGDSAPIGSHVTLIVSAGPAPVKVPDVSGQTQDQAIGTLNQQGFTNFLPLNEPSDTVPSGTVTRTDPPAGQLASTTTRIKIYVSSGRQTVQVPQELGLSYAQAAADLTNQGFTVTKLTKVDPNNVGKVVDMNPEPGTAVSPKSNVTLYVGIPPAATTTTSSTSTSLPGP